MKPSGLGVRVEKGLGRKKREGQDGRLGWVGHYLVWRKGIGESLDSGADLTGLEIMGRQEVLEEASGRPEGWGGSKPFRSPLKC